ncbi:MAG: phasin family protein [Betaproteobacteria bacterium]|nr:phasin family protein [Betaproteobacteria bacterium]
MAKKLKKTTSTNKAATGTMDQITDKLGAIASSLSDQPTAKQVIESAQQIWLAGLGAFSKAQAGGRKVFDTLVQQGEQIEKHTRTVAEATLETAKEQASKTLGMASGKFDKLEQVFEERVHKSLNRLGVLTSKDVEALSQQVSELSASVHALLAAEKRGTPRPAAKKPASKTTPAAKPAVKPIVKTATKATTAKAAPKAAPKVAAKATSKATASKSKPKAVAKPITA